MHLVDSLIQDEQDYFGALSILHPEIYEYVLTYLKKA
jgi:hypothetical protein